MELCNKRQFNARRLAASWKASQMSLSGYRLTMIQTQDQNFAATSGSAHHRSLQFTGVASDLVEGTVFQVTKKELEHADAYEPEDYKRVLVRLKSGIDAWVYLNIPE